MIASCAGRDVALSITRGPKHGPYHRLQERARNFGNPDVLQDNFDALEHDEARSLQVLAMVSSVPFAGLPNLTDLSYQISWSIYMTQEFKCLREPPGLRYNLMCQ